MVTEKVHVWPASRVTLGLLPHPVGVTTSPLPELKPPLVENCSVCPEVLVKVADAVALPPVSAIVPNWKVDGETLINEVVVGQSCT
jgi:hypothetical protein